MSAVKGGGKAPQKTPSKASAVKKSGPSSLGRLLRWLFGPGRSLAILLVLAGGVTAAIVAKWPAIEKLVQGNRDLWLTPEGIEITPPPAWIHSDIRAEVVRDASLNGAVSLLDAHLIERVRDAFALHPWVAEVVRVEKFHPARVKVDLKYRRPVAMVEVPGGLFPIDGEANLLPSADFSSLEAARYPRVIGIKTMAVGPIGTDWGDPRVQGAAVVAAVLIEDWALLGLYSIVPSTRPEQGSAGERFTYELFTERGTRVLWGASSAGSAGEATPAEKLARLKKIALAQGSLDGPAGPQDIDVRLPGEPVIGPRTADARSAIE